MRIEEINAFGELVLLWLENEDRIKRANKFMFLRPKLSERARSFRQCAMELEQVLNVQCEVTE